MTGARPKTKREHERFLMYTFDDVNFFIYIFRFSLSLFVGVVNDGKYIRQIIIK